MDVQYVQKSAMVQHWQKKVEFKVSFQGKLGKGSDNFARDNLYIREGQKSVSQSLPDIHEETVLCFLKYIINVAAALVKYFPILIKHTCILK